MGEEAPECLPDELDEISLMRSVSQFEGPQTATILGDKIYVVGGSNDGDNSSSSASIKIFDKLKDKWLMPTVLGINPVLFKHHSAVPLNKDRILLLKSGSSLDDTVWFLEVDTPFVREKKKALGGEVVAWSKGVIGGDNGSRPIVITGPSGVGKGTLISKLMKEFPSTFGFSVSHTTRAPREKEQDGIHYHFTERIVMERDIREGKFLEYAAVHGNLYGTSIAAVEAVTSAGKRCILDIDVQGARSVRASSIDALFIFICPPSFEELEKRLRARGTETEEQIQKRLRNAKAEIDQRESPGLFDYILVNDELETCYENFKKLLIPEEKTDDCLYSPSPKDFRVPVHHSVSKTDQIRIHCGSSSFMLDVSLIKGGAPGQTRGLELQAIDR